MIEKHFDVVGVICVDTINDEEYDIYQVVEELNRLSEENKQLKSDCDYRWKKYCNTRKEMLHENEQLKQQVAFLEEFIKSGVQYEYYQKIYDENKQLKQQNKELIAKIDLLERVIDGDVK